MRLREFLRRAREEFDAVPSQYREGVAGPVVLRRSKRHPWIPGYYTLGECVAVSTMFTLGESHLSTIFLYYGSFVACASQDPSFEMAAEIRETVRHEIRHHLEDQAGSAALRNEDAAEEQDERRRAGMAFAPGYWRLGESEGDRLWRLHETWFLEIPLGPRALERARERGLRVRWEGEVLQVPGPDLEPLPSFHEFGEEGLVVVVRPG